METADRRFRIALSFAGEKREFVARVAALLAKGDGKRVMPTRFGYAEADGLSPAAGFIELDDKTPEYLVTRILERLALNEGRPKNFYTRPTTSEARVAHTDI